MKNQEIVSHTRNSLGYNSGQIICLDDEKDAQEHDDTGEKTSSVPRPLRPTLGVIPFGCLDSNNDEVVTRSKVRVTLRLFQAMFRIQEDVTRRGIRIQGAWNSVPED